MGSSTSLYRTDQEVKSSMSIIRNERESDNVGEERIMCIKPDAVATLAPKWDTFGMIEIEVEDPYVTCKRLVQNDNCVLMAAVTAMVIKECISEEDDKKVRLPFIIATGEVASLYMTVPDENGNPAVHLVVFPDMTRGTCYNMYRSPSETRTKLCVALALLLNDFKRFFEETSPAKYDEKS